MQNRREPRYVYRIYGLKDRNPANRRKYDANMIHLSDIMGADTKFGFSFQANDAMMDIVTYNRLGLGDSGFTETYFYQKLPDGRYSRTYQINSSDRATGFVQYREKIILWKYAVLWRMTYRNMIMITVSYITFVMDTHRRLCGLHQKIIRSLSQSERGIGRKPLERGKHEINPISIE